MDRYNDETKTQIIKFLNKHYANNDNVKLAEHLNIIVKADNDTTYTKDITPLQVRRFANKLGLKKAKGYNRNKGLRNSIRKYIQDSKAESAFCSPFPSRDVLSAEKGGKVIICASQKQLAAIRKAAYYYNSRKSQKTGIHMKIFCDTEKLTLLLEAETISLPASCRTHSSPSEGLCVPP